jgi:periplasmic divalent cation tolerance protein
MKKENFIIVETTCSKLSLAKKLAKILLKEKLASCIHLQKIESLYFWEEKIENNREILLSIKTKDVKFAKIEKIITKYHEYKLPQIIATPIIKGSKNYLSWIDTNLSDNSK